MTTCKKIQSLLIQRVYGELDQHEAEEVEKHIQSCEACRLHWSRLQAFLEQTETYSRPEPEPQFWSDYWHRLAEKIDQSEQPKSKVTDLIKRWVWFLSWRAQPFLKPAVIAVTCLVIGLFIGRVVLKNTGPIPSPDLAVQDASVLAVSAEVRANRYIERSKLLFLGFVNYDLESDNPYLLDLSYQQSISRKLADEASGLKEELNSPAQLQLYYLVSELEVILLQIANLDAMNDLDGIELIQSSVDRKGLLFKINLHEIHSTDSEAVSSNPANESSSGNQI
ncbi:zf-HC2 domain-containing protein [bacterium]|nr:zf-HC2 domain-containing protein [bacterium]